MFLPYNVDVPMARLPITNWLLIGVTCLISIVILVRWNPDRDDDDLQGELDRAVQKHDPKDIERELRKIEERKEREVPPLSLHWDRLVPVRLFTHLFVHADPFHLFGNMLFLFVFGNAVNAKLGHWQYLVAYLLLGALAGLAWLSFAGDSVAVGASGAIMGIVGIFVVLFPRNDVKIFYCWEWWGWWVPAGQGWFGVIYLSAFWVVLFYVLCNIFGMIFYPGDGVGYLSHLAGAAGGFALGVALVKLRLVRSTRYEENLLEWLGYRRKGERRKAKKVKRSRKDRRTVKELLANVSDFDICEGMFRRILRRNGGEVSAVGLGPEERVVVLVWHSLNVVSENGFRALVEEGIVGDRMLERTAEAYQALGCVRAGNTLRKAAAAVGGGDTDEYADERVGKAVRHWAGLPAAEQKKFIEVLDEVEGRLAEYVRAHRDFFLTLEDEP
jgi:membrane associated rhomboid family serine protease